MTHFPEDKVKERSLRMTHITLAVVSETFTEALDNFKLSSVKTMTTNCYQHEN